MPQLTQWFLDRGISEDILLIISFIPILVTMTSISRYIFGIKTFGIYSPMVLAFSFYFMGARQAFIFTFIVILGAWLIRDLIRRMQFHYISRIAIIYCGVSIFMLISITLSTFISSKDPFFNFGQLSIIPAIMIISITDRFVSNFIKKGPDAAVRLTLETLIIAILGWALMRFEPTRYFVLNNLWLIPVMIFVNYLTGNYTGMRWTEFIRFNQVIKNASDSSND